MYDPAALGPAVEDGRERETMGKLILLAIGAAAGVAAAIYTSARAEPGYGGAAAEEATAEDFSARRRTSEP